MKANLDIRSTLMLDDKKHEAKHRYLPGDFVAQVYPNKVDRRVIENELTRKQIIEYEQYLVCLICKKPCAGTCIPVKSSHKSNKKGG